MHALQEILRKLAKNYGIEGGAVLNLIRRNWKDIVGKTIAVHTTPDTIKNRTLSIKVDTPQWMHHLSFFKEDIIEKLKTYNVKDVRFRIGRLSQQTGKTSKEDDVMLSSDDQRYLENTINSVKDEELKEKFKSLISHGLTKGKFKSKS
jgi:hypothetical protein